MPMMMPLDLDGVVEVLERRWADSVAVRKRAAPSRM